MWRGRQQHCRFVYSVANRIAFLPHLVITVDGENAPPPPLPQSLQGTVSPQFVFETQRTENRFWRMHRVSAHWMWAFGTLYSAVVPVNVFTAVELCSIRKIKLYNTQPPPYVLVSVFIDVWFFMRVVFGTFSIKRRKHKNSCLPRSNNACASLSSIWPYRILA
jgi:hypothetical protein